MSDSSPYSLIHLTKEFARAASRVISDEGLALVFVGITDGKKLSIVMNKDLFPYLSEEELDRVAQDIAARLHKADDMNAQRAKENAKNSETLHGFGA